GDRNQRLVSERAQAGKCRPRPCGEAFDDERAALSLNRHPCVTRAVATRTAIDESCRITELHQLAPRPEGPIVAVALPTAFELFWRHPVVLATKLFEITDVSARQQESPHLGQIAAKYSQRLCDMPSHGEIGRQLDVTMLARPEDGTAIRVIGAAKHLCDHRLARVLRLRITALAVRHSLVRRSRRSQKRS